MFKHNSSHFSNLVEALRENCLTRGQNKAFTYVLDGESSEVHLTYGELDEKGRSIAAWLQQVTQPGDRAILLFPPGLDAIPALIGCLYAGVVVVPVIPPRPNQTPSDLLRILAETTPSVILTNSLLLPFALKLAVDTPGQQVVVVATDQIAASLASDWRQPALNSESLAILHFTSGSTKNPRGVCFGHGNILGFIQALTTDIATPQDWTIVSWLPYYTGAGLAATALVPLILGQYSVVFSPLDFTAKPARWLQLMSRYQASYSGGPNFGYQFALDRITPQECAGLELSNWEIAYAGSESIRPALLQAFTKKFAPYGFKGNFLTGYGLSEAMLSVSQRLGPVISICVDRQALQQGKVVEVALDQPDSLTLCSTGPVIPSFTLRIIEPETYEDCSPDQIGELWLKGSNFPGGYWNQPEETKAVFENFLPDGSGPYLRTGDLGFLKNNELYIAGRLKDLIILNGRNYWSQDIEQVAEKAHPDLQAGSSAAFGVTVSEEEKLVLALELKPGVESPDIEAISHKVRLAVAEEFQIPVQAVVLVAPNTIPRTSSGKVQRYQARLSYLAHVSSLPE